MAKVIITIEDKDPGEDGGNINLSIEFDPEITRDAKGTPAQHFAMELLNKAKMHATADPIVE